MKNVLVFFFLPFLLCSFAFGAEGEDAAGGQKKYAVLIGVNKYEKLSPLRYAKRDIEALRDQLYKIGFEKKDVCCLTTDAAPQDNPTGERIKSAIEEVIERAREGDVLFFAMAGHGVEVGGEARFCPVDTDDRNLLRTTLPIKSIYEAIKKCKATFKLMSVDACRDNPFLGRNLFGARSIQMLPPLPPGCVLLQSCAMGQQSFEDPELRHGIFTYYLIEGLSGEAADDGKVMFLGLAKYVSDKTKQRASDKFKVVQMPHYNFNVLDFALAEHDPSIRSDYLEYLQLSSDAEAENFMRKSQATKLPVWKAAAEKGVREAQFLYGCYFYLDAEAKSNAGKCVEWFQKAADQNLSYALRNLGVCHEQGIGAVKDVEKAFDFYRRAADRDFVRAYVDLGLCYRNGIGVEKNETKAFDCFKEAAEENDSRGQCELGICYANGTGVAKDESLANSWMLKSANNGYCCAQVAHGWFCMEGKHVPKEETKAISLFHRAAEQNCPRGYLSLGRCYEYGRGVAMDARRAAELYRQAAENGDEDAKTALKRLGK